MAYGVIRRSARQIGRYRPGMYKTAWKAGQAVGKYVKNYYKNRSAAGSASSAKAKTVGSLSEQRDVTTLYRRKRAPRYVRRAARKFNKKVLYSIDKTQGMKTCIIQASSQINASPTSFNSGQATVGVTMYGFATNNYSANTDPWNGDASWIFARENGSYPTTADATRKLRFRSCTMNFSVQNTYDEGLYMDLYFVICRSNNGSTADPVIEWNQAINAQGIGNMTSAITSSNYYQVTPFDSGNFGRFWLIKSRKRVFMQPTEIYSFQMRDAGNYVLQMSDMFDLKAKKNVTEGVIMVFHNPKVDSVTDPGNPTPGGLQAQVTVTKTYHYAETSTSVDSIGV